MKKASFFKKTARIFKWSLIGMWRSPLLSLTTILIMTITLLTIAVSVIFNLALDSSVKAINEKMDLIIYIKESAKEPQILEMQNQVKTYSEVSGVDYIDKSKAFVKWQTIKRSSELKDVINEKNNPFPRSLEIKITKPDKIETIVQNIQNGDSNGIINKTSYRDNKNTVQKLIQMTTNVKKIGYIASCFFVLISILVVFNTMRLTIYSRREEIEIMTLVGAANATIKWPFVLEGVFYGIFGTIIATLIIFLAVRSMLGSNVIDQYVSVSAYAFFIKYWQNIIIYQLGVGILIGVICSLIAVRKYIKI